VMVMVMVMAMRHFYRKDRSQECAGDAQTSSLRGLITAAYAIGA